MRFRRRYALHGPRLLSLSLLSVILWTTLEATWIWSTLGQQPASPVRSPSRERIFIASIHWNNEAILRSHWVPAVLDLVKELGNERVYVSIQESGSWDDSKGALKYLDQQLETLGVQRRIILDQADIRFDIWTHPNTSWISEPEKRGPFVPCDHGELPM